MSNPKSNATFLTEKENKMLNRLASLGVYRDELEARLRQVETEMKRIEVKLKNS